MSTNAIPGTGPVTLVNCPLCATPVPFDATDDELDCATCNARLPLAADPGPVRALATAA